MRGGFLESPPPSTRVHVVDIESIPRVESVVLTGLDFSMNPERVRYEVEKGWIRPLPEARVKHLIKTLAKMIHHQEHSTPVYHFRVCNLRSALTFFLCAVHRLDSPQPRTHSRQNSNSSQMVAPDSTGSSSCRSPSRNGRKRCELPDLVTDSMLSLGNWDGLYYAVLAETQKLHSDLQERFGFGCENGTEPLHHRGNDGSGRGAITPIDLASLLETAWYELTDHRLVATLDEAVRLKNYCKLPVTGNLGSDDKPPTVYGLIDVNALDPDAILQLLWDKYRAEVDQACLENFEDESLLSDYHAKQYAKLIDVGPAEDAPLASPRLCKCHRACVCKLKCDNTTNGCTCNHEHIYRRIKERDSMGNIVIKFVKEAGTNTGGFAGAAPNTLAQMRMPADSATQQTVVDTSRNIADGSDRANPNATGSNRKRANTNNSDLAYVPDHPSSRRMAKDAYPLDFYGRDSSHRYPNMSAQSTASSSRRPSADQGSNVTIPSKIPSRKPVPPTAPASPVTPSPVPYPAVPTSQSQGVFTQSSQARGTGNPRNTGHGAEAGDEKNNKKYPTKEDHNAANDYVGLLSEHPSSINEYDNDVEPFPKLTRAITSSPPRKTKPSKAVNDIPNFKHSNTTTGAIPTLKVFDKPTPTLPEPNFIAPKPAVKQRYVSAGGNTPLSERTEIPGPAFHSTSPSPPTVRGITKEELDAKMSDPEWVRRNFGEDAVVAMCTPPRGSGEDTHDSKNASKRTSARKSDESDREIPRDRTSSSASKRGKLKRLFSRQNSVNETD